MHEALLLPNSEPNDAYNIVSQISRELETLEAREQTERSPIALVFDYESAWAWNIEPQGRDFSYFDLVLAFYRGLRRLGLSIDIVPPTADAIADRRLMLAPGLFTGGADLHGSSGKQRRRRAAGAAIRFQDAGLSNSRSPAAGRLSTAD